MAEKKSSQKADDRSRTWTFILYEDSAPDNWCDLLDEMHIEWVESPWHDRDVNADGEPKKKHKHILLLFQGKKSYEQIKQITDNLNSPIPQRCHSARVLFVIWLILIILRRLSIVHLTLGDMVELMFLICFACVLLLDMS